MRLVLYRWLPTVCVLALLSLSPTARLRAQAGAGTIAGTVLATGTEAPVASAQIAAQGTGRLTLTDVNGHFRLTGLSAGDVTLEIRRVGYRPVTQRATVGTEGLRILLTEAPIELNALVVTGTAGAVEKRSVGNAVSTIAAADQLQASAVGDLGALINGRAPGVVVTGGTGRAGAGTVLNIRGRSTLSLSQQPLIYVDGVRVSNEVGTGPRVQGGNVVSRLDDIAPEDIESIEIIKGPAAGTLYGTEASNGVVQIITKKGGGGAPHFSAYVRQGNQWFMNAADRMATNYARDPVSGNVLTWNPVTSEAAHGTPLFQTGHMQTYELNVRGGERALNYYLSSTYDHDSGIEPNNRVGRYTGHANLAIAPSEKYDIQASIHLIKGTDLLGSDYGLGRFFDGQYGNPLAASGPTRGFFIAPPDAIDAYVRNTQNIDRFTTSIQLNNRPTRWFTQRVTVGLDQTSEDDQALNNYLPPQYVQFFGPVASLGAINQDVRNIAYATLDYSGTATFNLSSSLVSTSSVGGQLYRKRVDSTSITASQFPAPGLTTAAAAAIRTGTQDFNTNTTLGSFVQQQLAWRDRMFLTGAVRVDNNSAFGKDVHLVTYPKISASWVVSDESFWRFSWMDQLRLRSAYGLSGQQPPSFAALTTYAPTTGPADKPIVTPQFPGNRDLKPERGAELEAGFEASIMKRVGVDFTYFDKRTEDAILQRSIAPSSGYTGAEPVNIGRISNHGFELGVNANAVSRRDLSWDIGANIATSTDHIDNMGGLPFFTILLPFHRNEQGFPIGAFFTKIVRSATYDPTTKKATNAMCDGGTGGNHPGGPDVSCATAPMLYFGTITPKVSGSLNSELSIGQHLKLHALADFRKGNKVFNADTFNRCSGFGLCFGNVNPDKIDPKLLYTYQNGGSLTVTDAYMENGSFWRLREVSATFTGPADWARRINASSVGLTIAGRNLHTWTPYTGLDPESRSSLGTQNIAFDQAVTPTLAQFLTTITVTF
ncbi:MAG TPA: SusC/RagA family TonB-linked outer membrane protein [Gemmatimonadaceae bacterium]|jgi:TonB-linked SusC/RagA family outer membrane protein